MIAKLITILLLSLLLVLAALFMLAKAKKEQLGKLYTIASSVAAAFGIVIFVFGLTAGIMISLCMEEVSIPDLALMAIV